MKSQYKNVIIELDFVEREGKMQKIKKAISIIVILILLPILLISIAILVDSYTHPDEVPSFFGWKPFIVLSGSMETQISAGDIVVVKEIDTNELKKGDIIAFKDGNIVITHRIDEVTEIDGKTQYITKGDNNNTQDIGYVLPEQVEGVFKFKIARLGNIAMFIQTPLGMIVCLSIPIIIIILLQTADSKKEKEELVAKLNKQSKMEEEIEKLKKQNEELMKK
jgi:signal peptidase